jgi:3-oxoacyl-[acyl-carrier protein] reductase
MKLIGQVALVTGAGRGIGQAIAIKLASEGADVVVNDIDEAPAAQTVEAIRALGRKSDYWIGSVAQQGAAEALVAHCISSLGGVDIIVNNAGYILDGPIHRMSDEQWNAIIDVHLNAPFRVLRAAAPHFRQRAEDDAKQGLKRHRKVVNISSTSGVMGNPGQANYSSAKAGVIGLTKALSKEWAKYRVNVNCVAFGLIQTRLTAAQVPDAVPVNVDGRAVSMGVPAKVLESIEAAIPLGRAGTVEEAAGAVYLFCTQESNYISGQVVICGGGRP